VLDTESMSMTSIITPAGPFRALALSSEGRWLYASQPDMQNIAAIDTGTRRTVRMLAVSAKPSILFSAKSK
jgi:VCBS repeat-containing protein